MTGHTLYLSATAVLLCQTLTMVEPNNDNADSATEPPKNKRTAERQITKDEDSDEGCHPMDKTEVEPTGTFQKADAATLAARKIVKVKRPAGRDEAAEAKNPFAIALSKTGGSVFGSAFGSAGGGTAATGGFGSGFGAAPGGFEFASKGATATGFGTGFGSTASSFGSTPTGGSIFGNAEGGLAAAGFGSSAFATATVASPAADSVLPEVDVKTGEEEELLLHEVRAKTFELVEEEDVVATIATDGPIPASSSIPPSTRTAPTQEKKQDPETKDDDEKAVRDGNGESEKEPSKEDQSQPADNKTGEATQAHDDTKPAPDDEAKKKTKWREVGIGPLRVLKKDRARVVQRRETAPGSLGTKLMVNIQLRQECTITRPSEKHLQLGAIIDGKPASFLFKLKNAHEAQALQDLLKGEIQIAESYVTGGD
jgi:type IV secretory pathway VirB10-like protein